MMMGLIKKGGRIFTILGLGVVIGVGTPAMAGERLDDTTISTQNTPNTIAHETLSLNSPIIDKTGILTHREKDHLESQLRQIYDDKLAQVAIVIVPTTGSVDIFDYAYQIAKRWQLGSKEDDDGILVLVALNDRKIQILTGYGVEGVLPDAVLNRIIREDITPSFKTGAYAQGLSSGISRIDERLRADPQTLAKMDKRTSNTQDESEPALPFLIFFGIVFGNILMSMLGRMVGATLATIGIGVIGSMMGLSLLSIMVGCVAVWLFVIFGFGKNTRISTGGGSIYVGGSRIDRNSHRGGFGSGGFGGGGGSFGGGGAGGSW
ncbi:TPM domain-containing protein [Moraxella oblonga]|uniref:TPM domain-containing protein n=1 Tax=Moraxella oblonga TaxID=200413 RepID=UPI0008374DAA|nr:TPM domain-containing protein [Moraxella oblonga]